MEQLLAELTADRTDPHRWTRLGRALQLAGRLEEAAFAYDQAVALGDRRARRTLRTVRRALSQRASRAAPPRDADPWSLVAQHGPPHGDRTWFCRHLAWAVPSPEAICTLARHGRILEVGAGAGLWARLLADAGARVVATDREPAERTWTEVHAATADQAIRAFPTDLLLVCWPHPHARLDLSGFRGTLAWIGEHGDGAVTLRVPPGWTEVERVAIPCWPGFSDDLRLYER